MLGKLIEIASFSFVRSLNNFLNTWNPKKKKIRPLKISYLASQLSKTPHKKFITFRFLKNWDRIHLKWGLLSMILIGHVIKCWIRKTLIGNIMIDDSKGENDSASPNSSSISLVAALFELFFFLSEKKMTRKKSKESKSHLILIFFFK